MTATDMTRHRDTHTHFQDFLAKLQKNRDQRGDFVKVMIRGHEYQEPGWAVFEVQGMHAEVNRFRALEGQPEVSMEDIWRVEGSAKGHCDYSMKFALYCTELALYGRSPG
jgi:hypothetical protein